MRRLPMNPHSVFHQVQYWMECMQNSVRMKTCLRLMKLRGDVPAIPAVVVIRLASALSEHPERGSGTGCIPARQGPGVGGPIWVPPHDFVERTGVQRQCRHKVLATFFPF